MKVAIYCRVSTQDQHADKQEEICREYCKRNGFEVFKVYKDVISGTTTSRKGFNQLLEDMRNMKFKAIAVTKLDRIGRSLKHLLGLFDEFNNKKVDFVAVTQNIDTSTSTGKLQMQIMGAFAEYERNIISERTKEGLRKAVGVGKRGRDKNPRKRRTDKKKKNVIKKHHSYNRNCIKCGSDFKTVYYGGRVCKSCKEGGIKNI
jgi:DNA invertase Pin-like site-specific DNA recombinase